MIKKVVLKSNKIVKKFPKFDESKIYVTNGFSEGIRTLSEDYDGMYVWNLLNARGTESSNTFEEACEGITVFILDNKEDLAHFILGCREFPKVEAIEEKAELSDSEASIADVSDGKIYAFHINPHISISSGEEIYKLHCTSRRGASMCVFNGLFDSATTSGYARPSISEAIRTNILGTACCHPPVTVYQFDTQEEFLRWALEKTTNKNFKTYNRPSILIAEQHDLEVFS